MSHGAARDVRPEQPASRAIPDQIPDTAIEGFEIPMSTALDQPTRETRQRIVPPPYVGTHRAGDDLSTFEAKRAVARWEAEVAAEQLAADTAAFMERLRTETAVA